jgi:hypothetical protein
MAITKQTLLAKAAAVKLPREVVPIPEFGCDVIVQGMSGVQRDAWEKSLIVGKGKRRDVNTENVRARLAVRCLVNEDGSRMFADGEAVLLGEWPAAALNRIFEAAQRLSGVSDEDVDEIKKASETADGSDSPLPSPLASVG